MARNIGTSSWSIRRKIIILSLVFCGGVITVCIFKTSLSPDVATTAITQAFWAGMAIIGSYVFGAVWDDKNKDGVSISKLEVTKVEPDGSAVRGE